MASFILAHLGSDGRVTVDKEIAQGSITADCWPVQFYGLGACKTCQFKDTPSCGGGESLKALKEKEARARVKVAIGG